MHTVAERPEYLFSLRPSVDDEFRHYRVDFEGIASIWDDETGEDIIVGRLNGIRLDLAAARADGVDMEEFCTLLSAEIDEFKQTVFRGGPCRLERVHGLRERAVVCSTLVYVTRLWVSPAYRGRHIGTFLMQRMGEVIDMEDGLIGLKAYPLDEGLDCDRQWTPEEITRLRRFYARLGFEAAGGDYMSKDALTCLATQRRQGLLTQAH